MNFEFYNPTKVLFGKGNLEKLGEVVKAFGNKALLVTGGGSVRRNGTFDKAVASLNPIFMFIFLQFVHVNAMGKIIYCRNQVFLQLR